MALILVLHGPNLNLLGQREPEIYGRTTLDDINTALHEQARRAGHRVECRQSNAEHELINWIQESTSDGFEAIIINPAAYTHTSVALRDALAATHLPFIEVHLSNPAAREHFRHRSLMSDLALGTIAGFGANSYRLALEAAMQHVANTPQH